MVNIEIDGIPLQVDDTKMIIQAADEAGIDIPRFCYHKKLSIAANCRMCLVEVEKSRKALPACATPVAEGMKIFTHSKVAVSGQRGVMEFLLINHPLDCPICDQAGECELQDLSLGYGDGISRFSEQKRVVENKDIGPLIQTDMTRCIHCTRCVRFGVEIAGIKELGATGRGEHMEIGTYVEHSMSSELSGNIIDLCPVGALTSKPFRFKARAWEMTSHPSVAPHDAVGSNIEIHTRQNEVMRVLPRDNDAVNESWLSNRDRFSYLGLNHPQRVSAPMIKLNGEWQQTDWQTAMEAVVDALKSIKAKNGEDQIAGLISPSATVEEAYLFQKWLRGLGINHIDHRLRQQDFADGNRDYNNDDWALADIDSNEAIVLLGCNIRAEEPIIAHRIRQAALMGTLVTDINFFTSDLLMPVYQQLAVDGAGMLKTLLGISKALSALIPEQDKAWLQLLPDNASTALEQTVAMQLTNTANATLFVGQLANHHPQAAEIRSLASFIARLTNSRLVVLPEANSRGVRIAGALPLELKNLPEPLNASQIWQQGMRAYVLFNHEPDKDCANPTQAAEALQKASFVVAINSFANEALKSAADVILPVASFAETSGTLVGADNQWQSFTGAVKPQGESRPGWKILRVLGNISKLSDFDYVSSQDVLDAAKARAALQQRPKLSPFIPEVIIGKKGLMMISEVPSYRCDSLVRRSDALQRTAENKILESARINSAEADKYKLTGAKSVTIKQDDLKVTMPLMIDELIADGCIYVAAASEFSAQLAASFALVNVEPDVGES